MTFHEEAAKALKAFPPMVRWFNPILLLDTARQAIASALFGQYADRRLLQAALDAVADDDCAKRYDLAERIAPGPDGAVWIDFVADLGDGFDSTYAIAYLLARPSLDVPGVGTLPRGQALIMGGDQVYPTATRKEYDRRMKEPYAAAFPRSRAKNAEHPHLFLIPGNHDWYDGLVLFLARFCRGRATALGSWNAAQHRSYFAANLRDNWWIWGIDTQLTEDIDQPQANYFANVARSMPKDAKIILVSGVPSWLKAEDSAENQDGKDQFYRSLDYIAGIAKNECDNATICLVLSGDVHHYSRYSAKEAGTQFITAGGGGAFLHPTHQLKDTIMASWVGKRQSLSLRAAPDGDHADTERQACYPSQSESRALLWCNLKFVVTNFEFCAALGAIFWLASLLLISGSDALTRGVPHRYSQGGAYLDWAQRIGWSIVTTPVFYFVIPAIFLALYLYADGRTRCERLALSIPHAVVQSVIIFGLTCLLPPLNMAVFGLSPNDLRSFFLVALEFVLIGGLLGGFVWGLYLIGACWNRGLHYNDAFSAMRLDQYRHFLRIRVKGDELTIYPLGLDASPKRSDWVVNPAAARENQMDPVYLPRRPLVPRLIEGPIVIRARTVQGVEEVAARP